MALVDFLDLAADLPKSILAARRKLRYISVYNLNIGFNRRDTSEKHWIYFPENKFAFYRAGFTSNFSKQMAPAGTTSMYIEVSRLPNQRVDLNRLENLCLSGLRTAGILHSSDRILTRLWIPIKCAYVIYDRQRSPALSKIFPESMFH